MVGNVADYEYWRAAVAFTELVVEESQMDDDITSVFKPAKLV